MRDRGGQSKRPSRKVLRDVYHLKHYGYKKNSSKFQPRKVADVFLKSLIGQNVGQTTGAWLHPGRSGGTGEVPFGPKFPRWMGRTISGLNPAMRGRRIPHPMSGHEDFLYELLDESGSSPYDKAIPGMRARGSAGNILGAAKSGYMDDPRGSFMDHIARLHDVAANRAFLEWMMEHHFKRPN